MKIMFDAAGDLAGCKRMALALLAEPGVQGLMILGCDANGWSADAAAPILKGFGKPVFGGIFPKIIHDQRAYDVGCLIIGLPCMPDVHVVHGLSDPDVDYVTPLSGVADAWTGDTEGATGSLIVFVDGLSKRISALVEALFFSFGLERNFIGGGAGSLSFTQRPCLITPDGLVQDAAVMARLALPSGVGVSHGWQSISDSMKVTESERNVIRSLDWRPAFSVYRELVERHSGRSFGDNAFFDLAKGYPFGINKLGGEMIVRDPLSTDGAEGLVCVGEVPRGSFVHLLNGTTESLIAAATNARVLADESALPRSAMQHDVTFFVDCISRALFLGDRLADELKTAAGNSPMFGVMTLGEIANNGQDYLEFYNKTAVVARFGNVL